MTSFIFVVLLECGESADVLRSFWIGVDIEVVVYERCADSVHEVNCSEDQQVVQLRGKLL